MKLFVLLLVILFWVKNESIAQNKIIDSLQTLLSTAKDDTSKVKAMDGIAEYVVNMHPDTGVAVGKRALLLAEKINWNPGMARSYTCIGLNYLRLSDSAGALQNYRKALKIYEQIGDRSGIAWNMYYTGSVYLYETSDYQKALGYFERSIKLFEELNDKKGMSSNLDRLGIVHRAIGNYTQALNDFQRAESIGEAIGSKLVIANCANHLADLYIELAEYPKALEYCKKAVNIYTTLGSKAGISTSFVTIGTIYLATFKYNDAIIYFQKAAIIAEQMGQKLGLAQDKHYTGKAYAGLFRYSEAMKYYQQSFNVYKEIGYKQGIAILLSDMGAVYTNSPDSFMNKLGYDGRSRYSIAAKTVRQSVKLSEEMGDLGVQREALEELSAIYAKQKDFRNAYGTYKKFVSVNDSIYTDEKQKQITHKEIEYEYDKKEALIKAAQEKKDALAAAEIKRQKIIRNYTWGGVGVIALFSFLMIVSYNKRKKSVFDKRVSEVKMQVMRLQMNPHFIFNCLHSINKYVIDNEKQLASEFLIRFAKLMRLILENSQQKEVSLESDLSALELYMQLEALRFKDKFKYSIYVDPDINTESTQIPPMLLQPFVENSIIHGMQNKEGGLIKVIVNKEQDMFRYIIEDNGIGREQAAFVKSNQDGKRESMGMKITKERLQIINQLKKNKSSVAVIDMKDSSNTPSGLRVELLLPFETAF